LGEELGSLKRLFRENDTWSETSALFGGNLFEGKQGQAPCLKVTRREAYIRCAAEKPQILTTFSQILTRLHSVRCRKASNPDLVPSRDGTAQAQPVKTARFSFSPQHVCWSCFEAVNKSVEYGTLEMLSFVRNIISGLDCYILWD